jgi:signal transduction histidine kinase
MTATVVRPARTLSRATALAAVALSVVVGTRSLTPAVWVLPVLALYGAGGWAGRAAPGSPAAARLGLAGTIACAWYALGAAELLLLVEVGEGAWLWPLNTVELGLDIAHPAAIMALLATYPTGRATPAARTAIRAATVLVIALPLLLQLASAQLAPSYFVSWNAGGPIGFAEPTLANPLHVPGLTGLSEALAGLHQSLLGLLALVGLVLLAVRYRNEDRALRARIRWLGLGGLLLVEEGLASGLGSLGPFPSLGEDVAGVAISVALITAFPVIAAIGIARPEAFDVDEALRRTVLFGALWLGAGGIYVGGAAALGLAAADRGAAAAVLVTLAATLAFHPLWQQLLRRLARRVFGTGLGGEELLQRLGAALEHTLDSRQLVAALAGTIREGLGCRWVVVELEGERVAAAGIGLQRAGAAAMSTDLAEGGRRFGRIECGPRPRGKFRAADQTRLDALGRQVSLAAHNALQAAELAASRSRIVEAEERGRRRLERDIHDGVQQEIVALIARIGLARAQLDRDPSRIAATLGDLHSEASQALADLRDLAAGIHPAVLGDRGIVDAIESRAARLPLGVTIECAPALRTSRFSETVEGAVYFIVCEGFANALKHSAAERVTVRLETLDDELVTVISDDGAGFDPETAAGTGLRGLRDRTEALGGVFSVQARPGEGTTLTARFPILVGAIHA